MEYDCDPLFERDYCVYARQGDFVEYRRGIETSDNQAVVFKIDGDVMVFGDIVKQQGEVEAVGALWQLAVLFV